MDYLIMNLKGIIIEYSKFFTLKLLNLPLNYILRGSSVQFGLRLKETRLHQGQRELGYNQGMINVRSQIALFCET